MEHPKDPVIAARPQVQKAALAVGIVFFLVGVLGFIPGITTNYASLSGAGHDSEAKLLGIFQISYLHNAVHLLFGVAGYLMARTCLLPAATSSAAESSIWSCGSRAGH